MKSKGDSDYKINAFTKTPNREEKQKDQITYLKLKLVQAFDRIQFQIKTNMAINKSYEQTYLQLKQLKLKYQTIMSQNKKNKIMVENLQEQNIMIKQRQDRKIKYINDQLKEHQSNCEEQVNKLKQQIGVLQKQLLCMQDQNFNLIKENKELLKKEIAFQHDINLLQNRVKIEQVDEGGKRRRRTREFRMENKENTNNENRKEYKDQNIDESKDENRKKKELTEDQQLSQLQEERKQIEIQYLKMDKIKRINHRERELMEKMQAQMYKMDSQISKLKRKIRQKY